MHHVIPEVFLIASTTVNQDEARRWLHAIGADEFPFPANATDAELLTMLAGKRCYNSFVPGLNPNVTKVRDDAAAFLDNILASRHGSLLEHSSYTFAIENVSRVFTAEMNRHRAGWAISEGSLRYIRFSDIPFWMPDSLRVQEDDDPTLKHAKERTQAIFDRAFQQQEDIYRELEAIWNIDSLPFHAKKRYTSLFRRIIGMGVATGGIWTGNLRALRHVISLRVTPEAEEEIAMVFLMILQRILRLETSIFGDFSRDAQGVWRPEHWKI